MTPIPEDAAFLWDMLLAAREARGLVANVTLDEYLADRMR
jgi:hypothetical protein